MAWHYSSFTFDSHSLCELTYHSPAGKTEDWPQSPEPPQTHKVWHWTDWRVSVPATWDSRQQTTYSRHAQRTQLPETTSIWPSPTSLEKNFYGSRRDLRATAAFFRETGLDI